MPDEMLPKEILARLKLGREQREVVGPLVAHLLDLGWKLDQIRFGRGEFRVPKNPSERSKREQGHSYDGFPVDISVFTSEELAGNPEHLLFIIETKLPGNKEGMDQLMQYLALEPNVKMGVLINEPFPDSLARFRFPVFEKRGLKFIDRNRLVADLPKPGQPLVPDHIDLTYSRLQSVTRTGLRSLFDSLLDNIVTNDTQSTRKEEQLDQCCNLILLKLSSDKDGKMLPNQSLSFQAKASPEETKRHIDDAYDDLVRLMPEVFTEPRDQKLNLNAQTIHEAVEALQELRLIDETATTVSYAFQTLRGKALTQGEGQYFTPQPVIEAAIKLLGITTNDIIIDPACGTGGFIVEALSQLQSQSHDPSQLSRWAQLHLFGLDKDAIGVKLTKAVMQILGDGSAHCAKADSVRKDRWSIDYPHLGTTSYADGRFTVVVTNPPFGADLKVRARDAQNAGLNIAKYRTGQFEDLEIGLLFLNRAWQLAKKDKGRIGIILPETYFFSPQYRFVLDWMQGKLEPLVVLNVPMEAFTFCRAKTNFYVFRKIGNSES